MPNFASRLKQLRTDYKMTQSELATALNVSQNAIYNWENGKREPSIDTITEIADYFVVSVDYLLTGKETEHSRETVDRYINKVLNRMDDIGYITRCDSEGNIWIDYPDGTPLDMTADELLSLIDETDSYLKFKLEDLRKSKGRKE